MSPSFCSRLLKPTMWSIVGPEWQKSRTRPLWLDYGWLPSSFGPSRPNYKPEFWDEVQELDQWTSKCDPIMTCWPMGISGEDPPHRIFETDNDITMLYSTSAYGGGIMDSA